MSDHKQFCPSLVPGYGASNVASHLCERMKNLRWSTALLRRLSRGMNTFLLRCGDVEKNPGPDTAARSVTKKGLFTVIHVNSRSLLRHFDDVACLVSTKRPHILALSETWLDASVSNAEIHIPGYSLFRSDRNRSGGGVAVYCLDNLPCSLLSCGSTSSGAESLWVSVRCGSLHPSLVVGCFYRPPGAPSQSVLDVCDNIDAMILNTKHVVACGDFNIDMLDLTKPHSKTFQNFITSRSLIQTISKPTCYNNSTATILDLFVTTRVFPFLPHPFLTSPSLTIYPSAFEST